MCNKLMAERMMPLTDILVIERHVDVGDPRSDQQRQTEDDSHLEEGVAAWPNERQQAAQLPCQAAPRTALLRHKRPRSAGGSGGTDRRPRLPVDRRGSRSDRLEMRSHELRRLEVEGRIIVSPLSN